MLHRRMLSVLLTALSWPRYKLSRTNGRLPREA
jgi:hypothetical protein